MSKVMSLHDILQMIRYKFLFHSPVYYGLGVILAGKRMLSFNLNNFLMGQFFLILCQITTHLTNDYYDYKVDLLQKKRSDIDLTNFHTGGGGAIVEGKISLNTHFYISHFFFLLNLIYAGFILPSQVRFGGVMMTLTYYFYTAPPLCLNYNCLGEITVSIGFISYSILLGYILQGGTLNDDYFVILIPITLVAFIRQLVLNIPDIVSDIQVNKWTFAGVLGSKLSAITYFVGILISYSMVLFIHFRYPLRFSVLWMTGALSPLPLGLSISYNLYKFHNQPKVCQKLAKDASFHNITNIMCSSVAFLVEDYITNHTICSINIVPIVISLVASFLM